MKGHALSGIQAVEIGVGRAVAYAGKLLVDLGASVTKIEGPKGDPLRHAGPFCGAVRDADSAGMHLYLNAGKQSMVFEAGVAGSGAAVRERLAHADIVLCAPDPEQGFSAEFDPKALRAAWPELIVVSVTPFGIDAARDRRPAHDITLQALGGMSIGIGLPGRAPLKLPGDQSGYQAGVCAAIAALGGVFSRGGALIDLAAADVWAAFYSGVEVANAHFGRIKRPRAGHRVSRLPYPRTILPCRDGFFAIQCSESRHWLAFLKMVEREDLADNPLFLNRVKANDEHGDACDAMFLPWFMAHTKDEILAQCLSHRLPGAPVYSIGEVVDHPHLRGRRYFRVADVNGHEIVLASQPFSHTDTAEENFTGGKRRGAPAPRLGQHRPVDGQAARARPTLRRDSGALRPLAGLRVVDFGWVWAGAVPGHILADMGAEVIKIEAAKPLDYMRQGRPIYGTAKDPEQNPMFHNVNRGKRSFSVNLDKPGAADVLKKLIQTSDVVIENFSPGVMGKYGLGWPALRADHPELVMCSMSAVGQRGPLSGIRTYATMIASLAGLDNRVAYPGGRVLGSQSSYADPNASLHAAAAILAALWQVRTVGEGAYIDLSQWEAAVGVMGDEVMDYVLNSRADAAPGPDSSFAPCGHYPVQGEDRWVAIAVTDDAQWQALAAVLDRPDWMADPVLSGNAGRRQHRARLDARLSDATRNWADELLCEALRAAGIAAAPLLRDREIARYPHFAQRALFEKVGHPVLGDVPVYRLPWQIDGAPIPITRRAPLLGEDNAYVLKRILALDDSQIVALRQSGALD